MDDKENFPYLTVGLHGVRDSIIVITLPKYLVADGYLDVSTLEEDGYSYVVKFEGDFEDCFIASLQKGDAMKVEIFSGDHPASEVQSLPKKVNGE